MIYLKRASKDRSQELLQYAKYSELFDEDPNNGFAFLGAFDINGARYSFQQDRKKEKKNAKEKDRHFVED